MSRLSMRRTSEGTGVTRQRSRCRSFLSLFNTHTIPGCCCQLYLGFLSVMSALWMRKGHVPKRMQKGSSEPISRRISSGSRWHS